MSDKSASNSPKSSNGNVDQSCGQQAEEAIKVAIRMRPLNSKETTPESKSSEVASRVWKVLRKLNSVTQTTSAGQPLNDRVMNRTFFTYDKTFGEKATTSEVYNNIAKGIVNSVVSGLNGTIFAYGQTSSGKTYTIQGSGGYGGMIDSSTSTNTEQVPGIVHMAARDIFKHVQNDPNRVYLLKVSYVEIYNEEVRDLLVSGEEEASVLYVREDARRGVFINANENIVTSFTGLIDTLLAGEKNRSVAATQMNERSSRSHTIFRITVESRAKVTKHQAADKTNENADDDSVTDEDDNSELESTSDYEDGSVLRSTLNLVDLAGSESVKHTGATGERMKEGGKINQSLLTLSRVMISLGQPGSAHINFRDSKLTRILQPSLSGNARMAVICCATPSHLYLEETRSTLQFASRAKLVKTNAKINEVIDERSLIKKLQKELAQAKKLIDSQRGSNTDDGQIDSLKEEIARLEKLNAESKELQEHLQNENNKLLEGKAAVEKESALKGTRIKDLTVGFNDITTEKNKTESEVRDLKAIFEANKVALSVLKHEKEDALNILQRIELKIRDLHRDDDASSTKSNEHNPSDKDLQLSLEILANEMNEIPSFSDTESSTSGSNTNGTTKNADETMKAKDMDLISHVKNLESYFANKEEESIKMRLEIEELVSAKEELEAQLFKSGNKKKDTKRQAEINTVEGDLNAAPDIKNGICSKVWLSIISFFSSTGRQNPPSITIDGGLQQKFI